MGILRGILAVLAGFLVMAIAVTALTVVTVELTQQKQGSPTPGYLAVNAGYSLLAAVGGGFVTGRIAAGGRLRYGTALAALMCAMSVVSSLQNRGSQPLWYQVGLMLVPPVCALAGAALAAHN
jgi:hypothetical protein